MTIYLCHGGICELSIRPMQMPPSRNEEKSSPPPLSMVLHMHTRTCMCGALC